VETLFYLAKLPPWFWVFLIGAAVMVGASWAAHYHLPNNSFRRAVLSTSLLGGGVFTLLAAQIWALWLVTPRDSDLGVLDLLLSLKLWRMTFAELPGTRHPICLGGWGLTAVLTSTLVVGGLTYWLPKKQDIRLGRGSGDGQWARNFSLGSDDGTEPAAEEVAKAPEEPSEEPEEKQEDKPDGDTRPTVKCVVIGYVPGEDGKLKSLVLATQTPQGLCYAGVTTSGLATRAKRLLSKLAPLVRPEPPIAGLTIKAVWVKPTLACEVHQSGVAASGLLLEPQFKRIILPEK
jgi:hypothetical protein